MNNRRLCINNFENVQSIGKGADGNVFRTVKNGVPIAVKEIPSVHTEERNALGVILNAVYYGTMDPTHIHAEYYDIGSCDTCYGQYEKRFMTKGCDVYAMRLYEGDLWSLVSKGKLNQEDSKALFIQLKKGLKELYNNGIAHNDLHSGNIFYRTVNRTNWVYGKQSAVSQYHFVIADFSRSGPNVATTLSANFAKELLPTYKNLHYFDTGFSKVFKELEVALKVNKVK